MKISIDLLKLIEPGSLWIATYEGYIHNKWVKKGTVIEVESILVGKEKAYVTFMCKPSKLNLQANDFRKKFKRLEV